MLGYQPWDNIVRRHKAPIKIALLFADYDNHARKFLENHIYDTFSPDDIQVERTQLGAPRAIVHKKTGSIARIFTSDQETRRLEGDTYHEFGMDEPQPREHYIALQRGLQRTAGKTLMTMTPLSEPWIYDEIYTQAAKIGRAHV